GLPQSAAGAAFSNDKVWALHTRLLGLHVARLASDDELRRPAVDLPMCGSRLTQASNRQKVRQSGQIGRIAVAAIEDSLLYPARINIWQLLTKPIHMSARTLDLSNRDKAGGLVDMVTMVVGLTTLQCSQSFVVGTKAEVNDASLAPVPVRMLGVQAHGEV